MARVALACVGLASPAGEPELDGDSDLWTVRYYASGQQCDDASEELERQGKPLRVAFRRVR